MAETDVYFRLRADTWQHAAIDRKIGTSVRAFALATGIPKSTMYRIVRGYPANNKAMAAIVDTLDMPVELLFERVEPDGHGEG